MIPALLYAILFGTVEASRDYYSILRDRIEHGWKFWLSRALRFAVPVIVVLILLGRPWVFALLAGACVATSVHRFALNRLRMLPVSYISTSNGYDRFWLSTFGANGGELAYIMELSAAAIFVLLRYV